MVFHHNTTEKEKLLPYLFLAEECYFNRRDPLHRFVETSRYTFFTTVSLQKGLFHLWLHVRDHNNAMGNRSAANALLETWGGLFGGWGPLFWTAPLLHYAQH